MAMTRLRRLGSGAPALLPPLAASASAAPPQPAADGATASTGCGCGCSSAAETRRGRRVMLPRPPAAECRCCSAAGIGVAAFPKDAPTGCDARRPAMETRRGRPTDLRGFETGGADRRSVSSAHPPAA